MAEVEGATPVDQNIENYRRVGGIVLEEEQNTLKNRVSLAKLKIDLLERILRDKKNLEFPEGDIPDLEQQLDQLLRTITELFAESERLATAPAQATEPAREEEIIEIKEAPTQEEEEEEPEAAEPAVPEERYRFPREEMLTYRHKIEVLKQIIKQLKTHLGSRGKISVREIDEKLDGLRKAFKDLRPRNWLGFDKIPEPVDEINALKDSITQDVLGENEEAAGKVLFLRAELRRQLNFIPNEKRETFKEETNFDKVSQKATDLEGDVRAYIEKLNTKINRLNEEARRADEARQAEEQRVAREQEERERVEAERAREEEEEEEEEVRREPNPEEAEGPDVEEGAVVPGPPVVEGPEVVEAEPEPEPEPVEVAPNITWLQRKGQLEAEIDNEIEGNYNEPLAEPDDPGSEYTVAENDNEAVFKKFIIHDDEVIYQGNRMRMHAILNGRGITARTEVDESGLENKINEATKLIRSIVFIKDKINSFGGRIKRFYLLNRPNFLLRQEAKEEKVKLQHWVDQLSIKQGDLMPMKDLKDRDSLAGIYHRLFPKQPGPNYRPRGPVAPQIPYDELKTKLRLMLTTQIPRALSQ